MYNEWWKTTPKNPHVADMFTLDSVVDESTLITKNGEFVKVVELKGIDYTGKDADIITFIRKQRQRFFRRLDKKISITLHSFKSIETDVKHHPKYENELTQTIVNTHNEIFKESFTTKHFLVLRSKSGSTITNILFTPSSKANFSAKKKNFDEVNNLAKVIMVEMANFEPHILTHDNEKKESDLLSFFAKLMNGQTSKTFTNAPELGAYISNVDIEFPIEGGANFKDYMVYNDGNKPRYATWFAVKEYPETSSSVILKSLFDLPMDFHVRQSFTPVEKNKSIKMIEKRLKWTMGFTEYGKARIEELQDAAERIDAGDIIFGYHSFAIQIFADSLDELNNIARSVINTLNNEDLKCIRETIHLEALFWSSLPDLEHLNVRGNNTPVSSENIADFITFQADDVGQKACTFGNAPHCYFKTISGANHGFILHKDPMPEANGNTIILGGSGAGKTTLVSFIIANATKYKNFKALIFDRLNGAEIPIRMLGGEYTDFKSECELNPFQLTENASNKAFLANWLQTITGKKDDKSLEIINHVITTAYELDKEHRSLEVLADAFGIKETGSIRSAIEKWLPEGAYGAFLNGKTDSLNFNQQLVGFDMTTLLGQPDLLAAISDHIFHGFLTEIVENPSPNIVFTDELVKFLDSPIGHRIPMYAQELRKLNGCFIGAAQEASVLTKHKYGGAIIDSCETFMIYPNATAEKDDYMEGLGLTKSEFDWVRSPSHRQVLVKRKESGSTILDVNLAHLGDYLQVFNSGRAEIARMHDCIDAGGDWRAAFLRGDCK